MEKELVIFSIVSAAVFGLLCLLVGYGAGYNDGFQAGFEKALPLTYATINK